MTASSLPYAVFGATGRTGAAAADALLRAGRAVRVVVRDPARAHHWAERGAEVALADLTDVAAMTRALAGVAGAYVVCPQDYRRDDLFAHADAIAATTARAAAAAGVPRLVALSSVGADRESGAGWIGMNHKFEQALGAAGVPAVFLRAAYFMENWAPLIGLALRSGALPSFLAPATRAIPMVATADVGRAAAGLLQDEHSATRAVTLAGPKDHAPHDVADVVSAVLAKRVNVTVVPEDRWPAALAGTGFSAAAIDGFVEMTRGLNSGYLGIDTDPDATPMAGTTRLEEVIADQVRWQR